jgi:cell division protein ZipA
MELGVRDWMIIIGVLLVVAVLLDGYRRMRDPDRIRVSLAPVPEGEDGDDDVEVSHELPNGGARVKTRDDEKHTARQGAVFEADSPGVEPAAITPGAEPETALPEQSNVGGEPPLLTEPLAPSAKFGRSPDPDPLFDELLPAPAPTPTVEPVVEPELPQRGENLDLLSGMTADSRNPQPLDEKASGNLPEEVFMLHVVSRDSQGFQGEDILQVLLAYDLRFGEMNFFHRHEESAGRGVIQFSVANMLKPGVFHIDAMSNFSTTGLIFFLTLPGPRDMMGAFDLMWETAQGVAEHLGGDVLDETRSATTRQTLEHMRQRIRDLERKLLAQAGR